MSDSTKDKDQEKGDEVLRRLLKTPPEPKTGRDEKHKQKPEKSNDADEAD